MSTFLNYLFFSNWRGERNVLAGAIWRKKKRNRERKCCIGTWKNSEVFFCIGTSKNFYLSPSSSASASASLSLSISFFIYLFIFFLSFFFALVNIMRGELTQTQSLYKRKKARLEAICRAKLDIDRYSKCEVKFIIRSALYFRHISSTFLSWKNNLFDSEIIIIISINCMKKRAEVFECIWWLKIYMRLLFCLSWKVQKVGRVDSFMGYSTVFENASRFWYYGSNLKNWGEKFA